MEKTNGTFVGQKINESDKSFDELGISVKWADSEPFFSRYNI